VSLLDCIDRCHSVGSLYTYRRVVVQEQCSSWLFLVFSIVDLFSWRVVDISRHVFNSERHRLIGVRYFKKKEKKKGLSIFIRFVTWLDERKQKLFPFYISLELSLLHMPACYWCRDKPKRKPANTTHPNLFLFLVVILFCFLRWWIQSKIGRIIQKKN
jgi:hypothetical protein